jgi:hopanoid biosynthesis associated protein HpnK
VPRALLVTGDDFGLSAGVNAAISAAHRDGILTSASLMVTGAALAEAVALARELPGLSTGLHLVLSGSEAPAASAPQSIPDLVDGSGRFPASPAWAGIADALFWRRRRAQIEREICAQIERFLETGLPLDHVDGHHHLHLHPLVFDLLVERLEEYGVRWVRLVDEDSVARSGAAVAPREVVPAILGALSRRARARLERSGRIGAADRLYGLRATGRISAATFLELLPRIEASCVELYAHPDRDGAQGRCEEEALRSPAVRAAVEAAGFRLVNTRELGRREAVAA